MKKVKIDNMKYYELTYAMINCGIDSQVFDVASKMGFNLPYLFYEKLVANKSDDSKKQLSKNLLGIYGNLIAYNYFSGMGYSVVSEYPVYDKEGNEITRADIYFQDKNGDSNYCEVKTVSQIIDNIRNYVDDEEDIKNVYTDKDNEIIKYKNIGKKLIKQVEKLCNYNGKVCVVVFSGCHIDEVILSELKKYNVNIVTIACNINELESFVDRMVDEVDKKINPQNSYGFLKVA